MSSDSNTSSQNNESSDQQRPQMTEEEQYAATQPSYLYNFDDAEFPLSQDDDDVYLPMMFLDYMDDGSVSLANSTLKASPSNTNLSSWTTQDAIKTVQPSAPSPQNTDVDQQSQVQPQLQSQPPLPQSQSGESDGVPQITEQQSKSQPQPQVQQSETNHTASSAAPSSTANPQATSSPQGSQAMTAPTQLNNFTDNADFSTTGFLSELAERINPSVTKPNGVDTANTIPLLLQQQQKTQQIQATLGSQTNQNYQQVINNAMQWSLPQIQVQNQSDTSNNSQQQGQQSQQQTLPQAQQLINPVAILPKEDSSGQVVASNGASSNTLQQVQIGQPNQFFSLSAQQLNPQQQFAVVSNIQQFQQQNQNLQQQQQNFQYLQQLQQHGNAFQQFNADVFPQIASNMSILPGQNVTNLAHFQLRQNAVNAQQQQQQQNQDSNKISKDAASQGQNVQQNVNAGNQTEQTNSSASAPTTVQQQAGQQRILPLTAAQRETIQGLSLASGTGSSNGVNCPLQHPANFNATQVQSKSASAGGGGGFTNVQSPLSNLSHAQYNDSRKRDMDHIDHSTDLMTVATPLAANIVSASDTDADVPPSKKPRQNMSYTNPDGNQKIAASATLKQNNNLVTSVMPRSYQPLSSAPVKSLTANLTTSAPGNKSVGIAAAREIQNAAPNTTNADLMSSDITAEMTEDDKALANRLRNREHARNTRARKKAYLESLKSTLDDLCKERDNLKNERAGAATRLLEIQTTRTDVLMSFFALRSSNELRRNYWSSILDETITCNMPVTPYRSFPASEVQVAECQRTIMGVDGMMADAASLHALLNSLVDRSRFPNGVVEFRYTLIAEEAVVSGNQMMARWNMSTLNASKLGAKKEVHKMGMLCAKFNGAHKIVGFDIMFDVMAFMLQLKQSANSFSVVPNTVQTCQGPFGGQPMVMTLADRPYTIVQVNKQWEEMTGWKAEEVVGKASCSILQGPLTERADLEKLMISVCYKRAAYTVLTNYRRDKERLFRNFLTVYPLSTNSKITHYAAFTIHFEWINLKNKGAEKNSSAAVSSATNNPRIQKDDQRIQSGDIQNSIPLQNAQTDDLGNVQIRSEKG